MRLLQLIYIYIFIYSRRVLLNIYFCGVLHREVQWIFTEVSEARNASILRVPEVSSRGP